MERDYAAFIMPTVDVLKEERYISELSIPEKNLYFIRQDYLNGKIDRERYEEGIACSLFYDEQDGRITVEESNRLYKKYM